MWVALASILMLFVALTSAYIVRGVPALNGGQDDWIAIEMPRVLWFNTVVLLFSSVSIELARRALKRNEYARFQAVDRVDYAAWSRVSGWPGDCRGGSLRAQGVFINSHPHSSFFYLLTSLHGLHLLGGVIALAYVTVAALRMRIGFKRRDGRWT